MKKEISSLQSQHTNCSNLSKGTADHSVCMDITVKDPVLLSEVVSTDAECIEKSARRKAYQSLVIEIMERNLDTREQAVLANYMRLTDEMLEDRVCIGDMLITDAGCIAGCR